MRWAIVASGTRKARAISAVVRPPTARRVSASCDGGESAGWQHRNSSVSVSSCRAARSRRRSARRGVVAARSSSSRRRRALVAAQLVGQPPRRHRDQPRRRVVGSSLGRPLHRRGEQRLLHRVLARRRSGRSGARARRGPAAPARAAGPRRGRGAVTRRPAASCISGRTSTWPNAGERHPGRDLERPLQALDSRRCRSCPGTPWPRGTGRRSPPARRRRGARSWPSPGRPRRRRR